MLEKKKHSFASFVTLTYSEENLNLLSIFGGKASLNPDHLKLWLKRLRKAMPASAIRFYAVGEYGEASERPHYHAILFGLAPCMFGQTRKVNHWEGRSCCKPCDLLLRTWQLGAVLSGEVTEASAKYVAGYVMKRRLDSEQLKGRAPEFTRMSLRPGIGGLFVPDIAKALVQFRLDKSMKDVPLSLRHGGKTWPLGSYIRRKVRKELGRDEKTPMEAQLEYGAEMLELRQAAKGDAKNPSVREKLVDRYAPRIASLEARELIYKQKRKKL